MENHENQELLMIPYVVHRDTVTHDRWVIRLLVRLIALCVILVFASNAIWLYVWQEYEWVGDSEETITTVDSGGDGIANYTGKSGGVMFYGTGYGQEEEEFDVED